MTVRKLTTLVAVALLLATTPAAFAQTPYDEAVDAAMNGSTETASVGDTVVYDVIDMATFERYEWSAQINPVVAAAAGEADAAGFTTFEVEVTEEMAGETVLVTLVGEQSGELTARFVVDGDEPTFVSDDELPETGADILGYIIAGMALIVVGGVGLLVARRRDRSGLNV